MNTVSDTTTSQVPTHVPPELVREFDFKKEIVGPDSYVEYKKLHQLPDIFYTPHQGGHWVVTRYDDMEYVFKTAAEFSSKNALIPKGARPMNILPLESDAPLHTYYRAILQPFFTPEATLRLEKQINDFTEELINELYPRGECEFMSDFALKMPIRLFMRLVDLPDADVPQLIEYANGFFHGETSEIQHASTAQMIGYVAQKLQERAQNPGDDLLSAVVKGKAEGGRPLTEMEMLGMATVLLLGGLDTVASTLGWIALFLARNPGHRQQLVNDPKLINNALEELMRRHHIGCLAREVRDDMVYKGITMKAGDMVLIPTPAAGLDERRFPDPFTVDFNREDKLHLIFGRGPHACIGQLLGRFELRAFLRGWLKRIPAFSLKPGTDPNSYVTGITHSLKELHLQWKVQ